MITCVTMAVHTVDPDEETEVRVELIDADDVLLSIEETKLSLTADEATELAESLEMAANAARQLSEAKS
ncbi:MAG: hypothetical protein AAF851_05780 [Myxococcota bacterium]